MDARWWDERYAETELVWSRGPNMFVERECGGLRPGRAVDLACGEGRNALWLARLGWQVSAVDFSAVALQKGRALEQQQPAGTPPIEWVCSDATTYRADPPVELVVIAYLQVSADVRRRAIRAAADSLAPGGTLLVVAHDSTNLSEGTGGPSDPGVLYTAGDLVDDLDGALVIDKAEAVLRPVQDADRPAVDALLRAHRPDTTRGV